jgi:hypothetical protein
VLFTVLYSVLGFVFAVLACASMLFSVKFHVGMREVWMLQEMRVWMLERLCGKRNFEEGAVPLIPSSTLLWAMRLVETALRFCFLKGAVYRDLCCSVHRKLGDCAFDFRDVRASGLFGWSRCFASSEGY